MGTELTDNAMNLFVKDLEEFPERDIAAALVLCRREIKGSNGFPPRLTLADVLERIGAGKVAEAQAAWDFALEYARSHVRYVDGQYRPGFILRRTARTGPARNEHCTVCSDTRFVPVSEEPNRYQRCPECRDYTVAEVPAPQLPQRVADSIHRIGGWERIVEMPTEQFTWVRREFLEQYQQWNAVEHQARALGATVAKLLPEGSDGPS